MKTVAGNGVVAERVRFELTVPYKDTPDFESVALYTHKAGGRANAMGRDVHTVRRVPEMRRIGQEFTHWLLQSLGTGFKLSLVTVSDHHDNPHEALAHAFQAPKTGTVVAHWKRSSKGFCVSTTTLPAERRWGSADGSPLHERTTAGKVGEPLEPGGARFNSLESGGIRRVKSEVACATAWLREARAQSGPMFLNTVRAAFAQTSTKKHP